MATECRPDLAPLIGDLVVTVERPDRTGRGEHRWFLATVPGSPQASWASRDKALDVATAYARRHAVDVWISDGRFTTRVMLGRFARPAAAGEECCS